MPLISTVVDDVTGAPSGPAWAMEVAEEMVRLDELIHLRASLGVAGSGADVDPEDRTRMTLDSFRRNGSVVSVDDRQVTALGERVRLHAESRLTFLKPVPLVGA